ncbi:type I polyketide synthase [Streptomyces sp. AC512_CC834]|uniref:type I polyketide synthase n=1 Tax=Streptomyces sp. AC512_CC834 TaxID=2823691 RepID=UPI001C25DF97|nr:type I polyketide synthase [Streptomyces sp. AC512_CC834]
MPARNGITTDPAIALVGIGCRYPGGVNGPDSFWNVLRDGVDVIGEIPPERWGSEYVSEDGSAPGTGYCRHAGVLPGLDRFDADFFGISFREAREMDPQQRLLLEVSWEALEHAGLTKPRLAGSRTGVFFGMLGMDYTLLHSKTRGVKGIDPYYASGKEFSFAPGRVAYTLGLHGPALSVNTACSSSLVAVHLACRSLACGEADTALAGGVNVLAAPELSIFMSKVQALSPTGRCKPFAADADGIVRGEGCGVVVLKRLDDALADGDQVLAVIRGSAFNHDGRSAGLTVPNATAQEMLLRDALDRAGATPDRVAYVEAHGTGTPLGDPIEAFALSRLFGPGRDGDRALHIGSHKANFGHTDAAAGVAALIKTVLTARHRLVPPQLHLDTPNPAIPWADGPLSISSEARPLDADEDTLFGVSAFGLSGTNAHVLLSAPPETAATPASAAPAAGSGEAAPRVLLLSGSTETALRERARDLAEALDKDRPLADVLHTAAVRRTHHEARATVVGADAGELRASLRELADGSPDERTVTGTAEPRRRHRTVFVFSGQGSQWSGMGLDLWDREPVAAAVLERSDAVLREAGLPPLRELLGAGDLAATELAQPAVVALQLAVAEVWRERGVEPDKVIGHSLGEISAACFTGALDLRTALDLAVRRGRVMSAAAGTGRMLAVALPEEEALAAATGTGRAVTVATVNGPNATVLAGSEDDLTAIASLLRESSVTARFVPGNYAFHSPAMAPYAEQLRGELDALAASATPEAFVSTVSTEEPVPVLDAGYWAANVVSPVRLWPAVRGLLQDRGADFIEIGPHPTLVRPLNDALKTLRRQGVAVGSLRRDADGPATLLSSLAELHCAGAEVDWARLLPGNLTELPRHPWQHESFWLPEVTPGTQYAPGAVPDDRTAPARLAVQLLDPAGNPVGPAQHVELNAAGTGGPTTPAEPPRSAGDLPVAVPPPDGPGREVVPSATAPFHPPAGAVADGTGKEAAAAAERAGGTDRERRSLLRLTSGVLAEVLGQDPDRRIPPRRGFADLGLDSLSIVEFVDRLGIRLGFDIPLSTPFEHPCLDELVDHLLPQVAAAAATGETRATGTAQAAAPPVHVPVPVPVPAEASAQAPAPAPAPAPADDPIAVVGMSCRFPGSPSVQDYWQLLTDGREVIRDVPSDRWDGQAFLSDGAWTPGTITSLRGGYLDDVRGFDAAFFRVSPREARSLDPQHRLFLEVAYEALEDAGATRDRLRGSATGVFVGMNSSDHAQHVGSHLKDVDLYYGTGNSFAGASGRLSYFLGLTGPSMAVDTACSSSLTAVHLAMQSLRQGESDLVVAGGVNVILSPVIPVSVSAGGALSPSGHCRTFDEAADGYLRGEGSGAVVLKRLSTALADGDRVYAVLPGSAVNQDGASSGLTVPNGSAQRALIHQALEQAGLIGPEVGYAEAHGTGTPLGDPIELRALAQALRPGGTGDGDGDGAPLVVGSAKPNIGHLEASAGMAGLIKTVLSVHHGRIAPHIGVTTEPTRQIDWERLGLRIAEGSAHWPEQGRRRIAGVSSFGFTGTNAHVLVAEPPERSRAAEEADTTPPARFALPLSAAQRTALPGAAKRYLGLLESSSARTLADLAYTASVRRSHLDQRAVVVGQDVVGVRSALRALSRGEEHPGVLTGSAEAARSCVFVFSGFGSQWAGMGRQLLAGEPVFRAAVEACEEEMRKWIAWSPLASLRGEPDSRPFDEGIPQELIFAVQVGLVELWRSWGVVPEAVVGHSMGEVAAAWAAGALTLAQAAEILCLRSRLLDTIVGTGGSIVVGLPRRELAPYLVLYEDKLDVATVNGPRTTVVAGDLAALEELSVELAEANVFVRRVKVPVAPHSPLTEPLRERLVSGLGDLVPSGTRVPFYSAVVGGELPGSALTAEYWGRNLRDTVLFQDAVSAVEDPRDRVFVEISPHPVLVSGAEESLREAGVERPVVLPSLVRDEDEVGSLLTALGVLHAQGAPVDWAAFAGPGRTVVDLPAYPWQRKEHWLPDAPVDGSAARGALVGAPVRPTTAPWTALLPVAFDGTRSPWQVTTSGAGTTVSAAGLLEAALGSAAATGGPAPALDDVRFGVAPPVDEDTRAGLQAVVDTRQGSVVLRRLAGDTPAGPALTANTAASGGGSVVAPADFDGLADDEPLRATLGALFPALGVRSADSGRGCAAVTVELPDGMSRHRLPADVLRLAVRLVADAASAPDGTTTPGVTDTSGDGTGSATAEAGSTAAGTGPAATGAGSTATGTGPTGDGTGSATAEAGSTAAGTGPAATGAGSTATGTGPATAEAGPVTAEAGLITAGTGTGGDGTGPAATGTGSTATGTGPTTAGTRPATTGAGSAAAGTGPATTGAGPTTAGTGPTGGGTGPVTAGAGLTAPGTGPVAPGEPVVGAVASVRVRSAVEGTLRVCRGPVRFGVDGLPEADVSVLDSAGRAVAELAGLRLAGSPDEAGADAERDRLSDLLYRMVWSPAGQRPADRDGGLAAPATRWLVCGDTEHLAGTVAEGLRAAGHEVRRVRSLDAAPSSGGGAGRELRLDPADREAWQTLLAAHANESTTAICDLWPLEDLESRPDGWRVTTALTTALADVEGGAPRLWLVTRQALLPTGHEGFPDGNQGAHAGLGRTLAMTRPDAWGGHVDLSRGSAEELRTLVTRLLCPPGDEHIQVEHSSVQVGSLVRAQAPERSAHRPLTADRWHLVTGAGGVLAAPVVDWLVAAGARRIVLADTEPAGGERWPGEDRIDGWHAAGAEIRTARTQGSRTELTALVEELRADVGIAGVVCAGSPGVATPLEETTESTVNAELNRAGTAELLHRLTEKDPVRLFVLLGSVPGTWGGAVTGAAAPSDWSLRALAARRRAGGLPVSHVELMPMEGSTLLDERTILLLKSSGIAPLRERDLVAALSLLAWDNTVHTCVADVDWELFGAALADAPHRELFRSVLGAAKRSGGTEFVAGLGALDPVQRRDRMLDWVCAQVAAVLGLSEDELRADQGFFDLGMDSVMSLTLRLRLSRELETELSSTVAFEHPTVVALTTHLLDRLGHGGPAPDDASRAADAADRGEGEGARDADGLDDLDDDELLRQLEAEISDERTLGFEENR